MRLRDRVAVITGGSSGIGKAAAELFAEEGAWALIADIEETAGEEAARDIRKRGGKAIFTRTDVSKAADCKNMIDQAVSNFGKLDILFNNAGVILGKPLVDHTEEEWDYVLGVNLKGVFMGCKYAIPEMLNAGGGSIVNNASISGLIGLRQQGAYCPSKGGVVALTRQLALDCAPLNIRVNALCPGTVGDTAVLERFLSQCPDPEGVRQTLIGMHPIGRIATPIEIARCALFLAGDESSFMTGAVMAVDGGYTAQ